MTSICFENSFIYYNIYKTYSLYHQALILYYLRISNESLGSHNNFMLQLFHNLYRHIWILAANADYLDKMKTDVNLLDRIHFWTQSNHVETMTNMFPILPFWEGDKLISCQITTELILYWTQKGSGESLNIKCMCDLFMNDFLNAYVLFLALQKEKKVSFILNMQASYVNLYKFLSWL